MTWPAGFRSVSAIVHICDMIPDLDIHRVKIQLGPAETDDLGKKFRMEIHMGFFLSLVQEGNMRNSLTAQFTPPPANPPDNALT